MAFSEENGMVMPVSPMYGGNGNGFGFGGDWAWIILLLLLGWGNGGWGGNGFDGGAGGLYPWMNQAEITSGGFRDQMINGNITSIRDGISDISTQLCGGFAGEGSATRFADANNTRDIIASQETGTRAILDKLCQLELDGVRNQLAAAERENLSLQNAVNMAAFKESQTAQNALITQGFSNEVDALYNRLNSCPVPTTPVYGRTPIFTCGGNNGGCGCGCGNNF